MDSAATMSSVQHLREFISQRLTAAAEEIFSEFEKTIVQYEEEIDRQRGLLDISWKPQIKLHTAELSQQDVCKEKNVLVERQLCDQESNSSVDQEEPEPPHIKEEQDELCPSQGEQLVLGQETDTFMPLQSKPEGEEKLQETGNDVDQYEEEIDRQRGLLDITWKPRIKLHTAVDNALSTSLETFISIMPPKKQSSFARVLGRGKGKKTQESFSPKPAEMPDAPAADELHASERSTSPTPPPDRSRESSVASDMSVAASISARLADDKGKKKKRAKKNPCNISIAEEELMLEFMIDNPMLWNVKMTDYRRKDKKNKIWEDQAQLMEKTVDTLKGWFRSLRDTHTRLDKKKSGDGAPDLTEREQWILSKFGFLKTVTRHRPEPLQSVKATIQQHRGDLDAAETACAKLEVDLDELTPNPSSTSRKRPKDPDSALLESLQNRIVESGIILKGLAKAEQQPITARTAFANYVRDSVFTMPNAKYKKARLTINRLLYDLMNEDSDDGISNTMGAPLIPATQQPSHLQQPALHPSSAPSFGSFGSSSPSPSEQYQPPPHMWRNVPPASSVWGSQSMEDMQQYQQQPFQHPHQQMPPQRASISDDAR
ncbi:uncharacterized protein LOC142398502 isoform X3 [Odontesthes bonariensis]|uniref:uncharacterized protein LOC142398502 isoform X3 n=1 Tax=Odontesthes bonariensis TaxID=219752 RepID=UPI003F585B99